MSVDLIARALAVSTTPIAASSAGIATLRLAATVGFIQTSGYAAPGKGAGFYVSDELATPALAETHPRFCKQSLDGRFWRLLPDGNGGITVEQGGAAGDGATNDQPACQAAIAYANAVGIREVRLLARTYALWCPLRGNGLSGYDGAGNYLVTRENLMLRGVRGRTKLNLYNSTGGANTAVTQTVDGSPWRGPAFYAWPASSMDWVAMEDIEVDGGLPYDPGVTVMDLSHKGFRVQDAVVRRVALRNVTMRNFGGEIFYLGGSMNVDDLLTENCVFDGSPSSAFNPGTAGTRGVHINLQAGRSTQAAEIMGGWGMTFIGGRFYDSGQLSLIGGGGSAATGVVSGYYFSYPWRETTKPPSWIEFQGTRVENCANMFITGYLRGKLVLVDTSASFVNFGKLSDVDLDLECWVDRRSGNWHALNVYGLGNATTQVPDCPAGVYYETPRNISIRVAGRRTAHAKDNGYTFQSLMAFNSGLIDAATCRFTLSGEAAAPVFPFGTPVAGFAWPLIDTDDFRPTDPSLYGANALAFPSGDFAATLIPGPNYVQSLADGTFAMTLVNSWPFQQGQRARVYNICNYATDRAIKLAKSGAGALLSEDRIAWRHSDYIDLRWDTLKATWIEAGYSTQLAQRFTGSATHDAPAIAAAGTATATVTVPGAALGMQVVALSFGIDLAGLVASGYVSAADTVTVVLFNPTGSAVDLASTTVRVEVAR